MKRGEQLCGKLKTNLDPLNKTETKLKRNLENYYQILYINMYKVKHIHDSVNKPNLVPKRIFPRSYFNAHKGLKSDF